MDILDRNDRILVKSKTTATISRLYSSHEEQHDNEPFEAEDSVRREDPMRGEMSALDFLPSFGRRRGETVAAAAQNDDSADVLKQLEAEYRYGDEGEGPGTVAMPSEPGSYPIHMRREYDTPVYAGGDDGEQDTLTLTRRRPTIVSHDVLMLVFSFLPPHLPTLLAVSSTCRAWRERSEYLAPHWDIVDIDHRYYSYYDSLSFVNGGGGEDTHTTQQEKDSNIMTRGPSTTPADATLPIRMDNVVLDDDDDTTTTSGVSSDMTAVRTTQGEDGAVDEGYEPFTVPVQHPSATRLFVLQTESRTDYIIRQITKKGTMTEGISIIYRKKRLFGLYPLVIYLVWISFAAAVAFAMGYLPNALDTDVKIGATFIFGIASLSGIAQLMAEQGCNYSWCTLNNRNYRASSVFSAYRAWNAVSVGILCLVVTLLAHRLAAVERLLDEQSYDANGVWSNGSAVSQYCPATANTTFPPALDFSPLSVGTSRYSWLSNRPLEVSFAYACESVTNVTTCFMNFTVLVAAYTNSLPTGCGDSNPARFIAFDVAGGINDTAALGTHDPLTYFAGGGAVHRGNTADRDGIQMKVPRDGDVFPIWVGWYIDVYRDYWYQPSTSSVGTNATVSYLWAETPNGIPGERNYDAAVSLSGVPWGDNTMPIVPYFGRGGVREMIDAYMRADGGAPKVSGLTYMFQSYNDLRDELIVGIWAVVGTALGGLFVLYSTLWCFRFKRHDIDNPPSTSRCNITLRTIRRCFFLLAILVCNPVMMLGFGTCYFKDPMPSYCMMSYPSALALFIVGVVFSCFACVGGCSVLMLMYRAL